MHEEEDSARLNHNRTRRDIRSAITELGKGINPDSGLTKKQHHQLRGRSRVIGCRLDYSIPNNNNKKNRGGNKCNNIRPDGIRNKLLWSKMRQRRHIYKEDRRRREIAYRLDVIGSERERNFLSSVLTTDGSCAGPSERNAFVRRQGFSLFHQEMETLPLM